MKAIILVIAGWFCCAGLCADGGIWDSGLAGRWYPGTRAELEAELRGFMDKAGKGGGGEVRGLILPHAGYRYSGQVAATGLAACADQRFDRIIIMGPSHRGLPDNRICIPEGEGCRTPLGEVRFDRAALKALSGHDFVIASDRAHMAEHSVEIMYPLLQYVFKDFKVVPVIVGRLDAQTLERVSAAIKGLVTPGTLLVASSDFTHYGEAFNYVPFPLNAETGRRIRELDMGAADLIRAGDGKGFWDYVKRHRATICGAEPVRLFLALMPEGTEIRLLGYDNSGSQTGDFAHSVSYAAFAAGKNGDGGLLKLARESIGYYLKHRRTASAAELGYKADAAGTEKRGVFVTLRLDGHLRGCIGEIFPRRPLYQAVIEQAVNAAFNDPRFRQLSKEEFGKIKIEISVLTPPRRVGSYRDIVIGRDGMILRKGGAAGLFLPQVATEQGWGPEETLSHLSLKAGLAADAWKEGCEFETFQARVFGEDKP